jgi:hypothetical protein
MQAESRLNESALNLCRRDAGRAGAVFVGAQAHRRGIAMNPSLSRQCWGTVARKRLRKRQEKERRTESISAAGI